MYLDSCILVKLLSPEPDSALFSQYCAGRWLHTSELAWTEVFAALLAKERAGKIPRELRERAVERFQSLVHRGTLAMVPLNRVTLNKANSVLTQCHPDIPVRTLDAIHVASADLCQQFPVVTTDQRMRDAAGRLGLPVFPSEPT
ncbi:MAG: type II toxin-antitoxin system VapC family toxin [Verrucomicrobiae bacterium]|nr:type II toxin-antitoxin system VapC family toxin [Verrucomicrobiae bacterium]